MLKPLIWQHKAWGQPPAKSESHFYIGKNLVGGQAESAVCTGAGLREWLWDWSPWAGTRGVRWQVWLTLWSCSCKMVSQGPPECRWGQTFASHKCQLPSHKPAVVVKGCQRAACAVASAQEPRPIHSWRSLISSNFWAENPKQVNDNSKIVHKCP